MAGEIVEGALLRPDGSFAPARLELRDGVVSGREDGGPGNELSTELFDGALLGGAGAGFVCQAPAGGVGGDSARSESRAAGSEHGGEFPQVDTSALSGG